MTADGGLKRTDAGRDLLGCHGEVGDVLFIVGHSLSQQCDILRGHDQLCGILSQLSILIINIEKQRIDLAQETCCIAHTYHAQDAFSVDVLHTLGVLGVLYCE